ncbi:MAG: 50S ribosome-binding GTPase [Candidatus Omnitrophica bacterium]|nr:50S ribosome-binding GTPase [Candidatus Omnitrophota bacterium]MBU2044355.1 50S ribosome-binding GTPase [Candidatus Omnitrophota bacterium]MBU2251285.1 50S ribosome-binding GTPase [Candidatus Omnitrophota bacterium]MBU2473800.1 50S ribosome-binding GTPase [Candidatus Omnitrophota bacterium]
MIFDKAKVLFKAGSGGKGSSAMLGISASQTVGFGGDGGKGASVILKVSPHSYDLKDFKGNKIFAAPCGEPGSKKHKKGKDAKDLIVYLPQGTRVIKNDKLVVDLVEVSDEFLLCRGGQGGLGTFKRDYTVPPEPGQEREVVLDYRIINDLAILGFANSGKTTLFNALTGQSQKVADYPFTTTSCMWAPAEFDCRRPVVLDTPPLSRLKKDSLQVKNAFLNHILRSQAVILLAADQPTYQSDFKAMIKIIEDYDRSLLEGKKIIGLARDKNAYGVYLSAKIDTIGKKTATKSLDLEAVKKKLVKLLIKDKS